MIPLEDVLALLDELRAGGLDLAERPAVDQRDAWAFGRVNGILYSVGWLRERLNEIVEERERADEN